MEVPGSREINNTFPDFYAEHIFKINEYFKNCFPEYSLILDGCPLFDEAECVMVRIIHKKTLKIKTLVISVGLYPGSLDGDTICDNIVELINGDPDDAEDDGFALSLKGMRAASIDRASPNKSGLATLKAEHHINPFEAYCMSHGTANCGNKAYLSV